MIFVFFTSTIDLVIKAAVGSTAFTVFALPGYVAKKRNVIGGQVIGAGIGMICSILLGVYLQGGLAVTLATLLMVTTDTEHPPAAGTALGLALALSWKGGAFVLAVACILTLLKMGLSDRLEDLT